MGKLTDKFLGAFNSKDDDYDEFDDEFDDDVIEEDDLDEPEERGGFFKKKAAPAAEEKEVREARDSREPAPRSASGPLNRAPKASRSAASRMNSNEVCIFKPSSIEDSREITETLLQGKAVVINFEGLHVEISQRIIDFISGSCYALDGNLQKISNYIFIATPNSVDISGDFQDLFGGNDGSYDIAGFKPPVI